MCQPFQIPIPERLVGVLGDPVLFILLLINFLYHPYIIEQVAIYYEFKQFTFGLCLNRLSSICTAFPGPPN